MQNSSKIKRARYLMLMVVLNETIDQLAMANNVPLAWSCVEERGWICLEQCIIF